MTLADIDPLFRKLKSVEWRTAADSQPRLFTVRYPMAHAAVYEEAGGCASHSTSHTHTSRPGSRLPLRPPARQSTADLGTRAG